MSSSLGCGDALLHEQELLTAVGVDATGRLGAVVEAAFDIEARRSVSFVLILAESRSGVPALPVVTKFPVFFVHATAGGGSYH